MGDAGILNGSSTSYLFDAAWEFCPAVRFDAVGGGWLVHYQIRAFSAARRAHSRPETAARSAFLPHWDHGWGIYPFPFGIRARDYFIPASGFQRFSHLHFSTSGKLR